MDDYIKREDAVALLSCFTEIDPLGNTPRVIAEHLPAADVRPVVFCKDCKSCNTDISVGGWYGSCAFWNSHSVMDDDYCSRFRYKDSEDMREDTNDTQNAD